MAWIASTAGTALEWPSGSRERWVRWLPCYRLSDSTGLWSPPTGVGGRPPQLNEHGPGHPQREENPSPCPHSRGGKVSCCPTVGLAWRPTPLRPLGLSHTVDLGTFEPLPVAGIPQTCSWAGWVGLRPPPPQRGVAPAPPSSKNKAAPARALGQSMLLYRGCRLTLHTPFH